MFKNINWKEIGRKFLLYVLLPLLGLEAAAEQFGLTEPAPQEYAAPAPRIGAPRDVIELECVTEPAQEFVNENFKFYYTVDVQVMAQDVTTIKIANFEAVEVPDTYLVTKRIRFSTQVGNKFFGYAKPAAVREFFTECAKVGQVVNIVDAPDLERIEKLPPDN